jgi:hypothetical protein
MKRDLKESLPPILAASINDQALYKQLRRARKLSPFANFNRPSWQECTIPDFLKETRRRTPFLFYDSNAEDLIVAREQREAEEQGEAEGPSEFHYSVIASSIHSIV